MCTTSWLVNTGLHAGQPACGLVLGLSAGFLRIGACLSSKRGQRVGVSPVGINQSQVIEQKQQGTAYSGLTKSGRHSGHFSWMVYIVLCTQNRQLQLQPF